MAHQFRLNYRLGLLGGVRGTPPNDRWRLVVRGVGGTGGGGGIMPLLRLVPYFILIVVRFLQYCTGCRIYLRLGALLNRVLALFEVMRCVVWARRVRSFRRLVGPRLFIGESLRIIYLTLRLRDPRLLADWVGVVLGRIDF